MKSVRSKRYFLSTSKYCPQKASKPATESEFMQSRGARGFLKEAFRKDILKVSLQTCDRSIKKLTLKERNAVDFLNHQLWPQRCSIYKKRYFILGADNAAAASALAWPHTTEGDARAIVALWLLGIMVEICQPMFVLFDAFWQSRVQLFSCSASA
jgi:hypothetical protein